MEIQEENVQELLEFTSEFVWEPLWNQYLKWSERSQLKWQLNYWRFKRMFFKILSIEKGHLTNHQMHEQAKQQIIN